MIGITVGRSTKTNALFIYNPITKQYYEPDMYKFDLSCHPCTKFPSQIHYDGGLHAELYHHSLTKNTPELYLLGMPLKTPINKYDGNNYTTDIVVSTPIHYLEGNTMPYQYLIQIHDGSTFTKSLTKMDVIADSPINKTRVAPNPSLPVVDSLPAWL